jgi:hypothetical protein
LLRCCAARRRETAEAVAAGDDAVARDDDRPAVATERLADLARRRVAAHAFREFAVGDEFAGRDRSRGDVDAGVERLGIGEIQSHVIEVDPLAAEQASDRSGKRGERCGRCRCDRVRMASRDRPRQCAADERR